MNKKKLFSVICGFILVAATLASPAFAAYLGYPTADSYTYLGDPDTAYGLEENMMLDASNVVGCVMSSYMWFKYELPPITGTVSSVTLQLNWVDIDLGPYTMPVELLSSSNITWDEASLNWTNQPDLDPVVLARAPDAPNGGTVTFQSAELTNYVVSHAGQTITFVARADCTNPSLVVFNPVRMLRAREFGTSGAVLTLDAPTSLGVLGMNVKTFETQWMLFAVLLVSLVSAGFVRRKYARR